MFRKSLKFHRDSRETVSGLTKVHLQWMIGDELFEEE